MDLSHLKFSNCLKIKRVKIEVTPLVTVDLSKGEEIPEDAYVKIKTRPGHMPENIPSNVISFAKIIEDKVIEDHQIDSKNIEAIEETLFREEIKNLGHDKDVEDESISILNEFKRKHS